MFILSDVGHLGPPKMFDNDSLGMLDSWFRRKGPEEVGVPTFVAEHWRACYIGHL